MTVEHHLVDSVEKAGWRVWKLRCSCGAQVRASDVIAAHQAHELHIVDVGVASERGE